jgi:hypothetical protein
MFAGWVSSCGDANGKLPREERCMGDVVTCKVVASDFRPTKGTELRSMRAAAQSLS